VWTNPGWKCDVIFRNSQGREFKEGGIPLLGPRNKQRKKGLYVMKIHKKLTLQGKGGYYWEGEKKKTSWNTGSQRSEKTHLLARPKPTWVHGVAGQRGNVDQLEGGRRKLGLEGGQRVFPASGVGQLWCEDSYERNENHKKVDTKKRDFDKYTSKEVK